MTDRQRLTRLVRAAADFADARGDCFPGFVLGALLLALAQGTEQELARRLAEAEGRAEGLKVADVFPGAKGE